MRSLRAAIRLGFRASPAATAGLLLLVLVAAAPPVAAAWCTKLLLDEVSQGSAGDARAAFGYAALGALSLALGTALNRGSGYLAAVVQSAIQVTATEQLHDRVNGYLGLRPFEDPAFRDRLALAQQAAVEAPYVLLTVAVMTVQSGLTMLGFIGILFTLWPPAGLLVLAIVIPECFVQRRLARRAVRAAEDSSSLIRTQLLFQGLLTDLRAVREIRLYQLGAFFLSRLSQALRRANAIQLRTELHASVVQASWSLVLAVATAAATIGAVAGVLAGRITVGDLMLFVAALAAVQNGLSAIVAQLGEAGVAVSLFRHYVAVVDGNEDLSDGVHPTPPLRTAVVFRDVWFRYDPDGPWVLRGLDLTLPAGDAIGLVGVNGAGKSTLVKLLCRFYDPERGSISWDGVDLRELRVSTLRERLGAVFQDFMCYDLTAEDNIRVGRLETSSEQVRTAARRAEVDHVLAALPDGFHTLLSRSFLDDDGHSGVTLSGGQWQRVALARSFMRADADLLILDEPSAGLDVEAEARIHANLRQIRQGRCGLLISHRLSTLRDADRIAVLDGGCITETGHHDDLMTAGGTYARLFTLQADGYQLAAER